MFPVTCAKSITRILFDVSQCIRVQGDTQRTQEKYIESCMFVDHLLCEIYTENTFFSLRTLEGNWWRWAAVVGADMDAHTKIHPQGVWILFIIVAQSTSQRIQIKRAMIIDFDGRF